MQNESFARSRSTEAHRRAGESGRYATPEDVVAAALLTLDQQEWLGDFSPGEVDAMLAEGEQSIEQQDTLDGNDAFLQRRARRAGKQTP
jgi:Arc/MetJ-type ribon-helix-helix transcriptional regulator